MNCYIIHHKDAPDSPCMAYADTRSKAKYKNYLDWMDAFGIRNFKQYLKGVTAIHKEKEPAHE